MDWRYVMLHHSLTPDSGTVSWNAIRRFHVHLKGWHEIGYHFGAELVADPLPGVPPSYEVMLGRSPLQIGAHCYQDNMNRLALGVCLVGNFDLAPPPPGQLAATARLVRWLLVLLNVGPENVIAHGDHAPKTCPGSKFDMNEFRSRLR
jgi:hypothetical protein